MTIEELKMKKSKFEGLIEEKIVEFEEETGVNIADINIIAQNYKSAEEPKGLIRIIEDVKIDLEL